MLSKSAYILDKSGKTVLSSKDRATKIKFFIKLIPYNFQGTSTHLIIQNEKIFLTHCYILTKFC
jgi:hypothetical protein